MADWLKGLGYYIPPELRNWGAPLKWLAESQRTPQIVNNPNVKKLMTSTSNLSRGSNLLKAITDYTIAGLDVTGGGRVLTAPSKIAAKGGKYIDDLIKSGQVKKASEITDDPLTLMSRKRDRFGRIIQSKKEKLASMEKGKKLTEAINDIDLNLIKTFSMKDLKKHLLTITKHF